SASTATGARRTTAPRRPGSSASRSPSRASSAVATCVQTSSLPGTSTPGSPTCSRRRRSRRCSRTPRSAGSASRRTSRGRYAFSAPTRPRSSRARCCSSTAGSGCERMTNGSMNGRRRVVITGLGAVTPLGVDVESTWDALVAGRSGAGEITQFDSTDYAVHFACEATGFDPTQYIERKQARRMDRFAHLIVAAARPAEADSGISIESGADRVGAAVATGIGGLKAFQDCYDELLERGPDRVNPFSIPEIIPNMGAAWVSMQLGTKGPLSSQCTACAASNMAIGDGLDSIRLGRADVMLCGGTEAPITEVGIAGFSAMRALSRRNDAPEKGSRPFDAGRDGFVMGEAGAVVVLEELEHAQRRGAKIYAELLGYGL